jgi:small subunit ribosomal protein S9
MSETASFSRQNPIWAVGRRKNARARVRIVPGEGRFIVNAKSLDEFFGGHARQKSDAMAPLKQLSRPMNDADIFVTTEGGGVTGQAGAIKLGLARALVAIDGKLRPVMRKMGFLTRDPRMVERKKYGQPKARRRYQHSKR